MSLSASTIKSAKDAVRNVPDLQVQLALLKVIDLICAAAHPTAAAIDDGEIDVSATPVLTVANGIITAAEASE